MIAPLRRHHLTLVSLLAVLLIAAFLTALVVRQAPPVSTPLPAPFADAQPASTDGGTP